MWTLLFFVVLFAAIKAADYSRFGRRAFQPWDILPASMLIAWLLLVLVG